MAGCTKRQVGDEGGDVCSLHSPAVLRSYLDGVTDGRHQFPPIARHLPQTPHNHSSSQHAMMHLRIRLL